jgi:hypothetical protein
MGIQFLSRYPKILQREARFGNILEHHGDKSNTI